MRMCIGERTSALNVDVVPIEIERLERAEMDAMLKLLSERMSALGAEMHVSEHDRTNRKTTERGAELNCARRRHSRT